MLAGRIFLAIIRAVFTTSVCPPYQYGHHNRFSRITATHRLAGCYLLVVVLLCASMACGGAESNNSGSTSAGDTNSGAGTPSTGSPTAASSTASNASVQVDFGNRAQGQIRLPASILSVNRGVFGTHELQALQIIHRNGVAMVRLDATLSSIYETPTANWTKLDAALSHIQAVNLAALVILDYTPKWLQSPLNLCASREAPAFGAFPANFTIWGTVAASIVHHIDVNFPGLVYGYEIWNEPDSPYFNCNTSSNTTSSRMNAYFQLYGVVAPILRAQANADGVTVRIGGPVVATPADAILFLPQFVNNPVLAPYIDFVSYHDYISGATWDGQGQNLLNATTDAGQGVGANYAAIAAIVQHGLQPNAQQTPILITEYNIMDGCCRISPQFSPLFNSVFVATLLNAAYTVGEVPAHINYYSANTPDGYCLLATSDTSCAYDNGPFRILPPLYTFNLIGSPDYLDMNNGGFLAAVSSNTPSLVATAFYTQRSDSVVIINAGASPIATTISIANTSLSAANATLFELNAQYPTISSQALPLSETNDSYTASVTAPPYTVLGISIR